MKLILSLQPGNKLQIPLEIPEDEIQSDRVSILKFAGGTDAACQKCAVHYVQTSGHCLGMLPLQSWACPIGACKRGVTETL